jgi:eukaryotic-like serine/threonine-protein kinase
MKKLYWLALPVVLCAAIVYWHMHRAAPFHDTDYLLLGEITNRSGEPDFDGSLRGALGIALDQSPHLNLISNKKFALPFAKRKNPIPSR